MLTPRRADGAVSGRTFRLLWAGQTVSVIGDGAASLAVPLLVLRATGSPVLGALAATPRTVAYLLVGLVAGPLVDRWRQRRLMIACEALRVLAFVVLPLTTLAPGGVWLALAVTFLASSAGVFFETALAVVVQLNLREDQLVAGNARLEASNQLGLLLGPSLIGVGVTAVGIPACLWFNAATFLVSGATLLRMRLRQDRPGSRTPSRRGLWRELRDGLGYIRGHALIARLVSLQAVINFVIAAETLVVFHATVDLRASSAWSGVVVAAAGLGGVCASSLANRLGRRFDPGALIGWSVAAIGGSLLGLGLAPLPALLAAANFLHGGLSVFASVHIRALRQRVVPASLLGRVTATARTLAMAANPLGAVIFGWIAAAAGRNATWSFLTAAALSVASAAVAHRGLVRPARPLRTPDQPAAERARDQSHSDGLTTG
jgi:MFS family permease